MLVSTFSHSFHPQFLAPSFSGEERVRAAVVRGHLGGQDGHPAARRRTGHAPRLRLPQGTTHIRHLQILYILQFMQTLLFLSCLLHASSIICESLIQRGCTTWGCPRARRSSSCRPRGSSGCSSSPPPRPARPARDGRTARAFQHCTCCLIYKFRVLGDLPR